MYQSINSNNLNEPSDEINLRELFYILWQGKWIIFSITLFISTIGVIYSLLLPNIYESKAILAPVDSSNNISGALSGYSGLASFAGISIPSVGSSDNSTKALEKITTLSFFENNILKNIYLPDLMAVQSWDHKTNKIVYDEDIFNETNNTWTRDYSFPRQAMPSAQESFEVFKTKHLILNEDSKTGLVSLKIRHQSPYIARQWADLVVNEVNSFYRQKDKLESEKAVIYLNQQISITGLSEIKEVLAQLLQEEMKRLTLIEANQSYVFEFIDPPAPMEKKSEPKRFLILILSTLLGGLLSILFVTIRHYAFNGKFN